MAAEAMSAKVPFVTSIAGALPEVAGRDYSYQVAPGKAQELADAVAALVDTTPTKRAKQAEKEWQRWQRKFSPEAATKRIAAFLTDVLPQEVK